MLSDKNQPVVNNTLNVFLAQSADLDSQSNRARIQESKTGRETLNGAFSPFRVSSIMRELGLDPAQLATFGGVVASRISAYLLLIFKFLL